MSLTAIRKPKWHPAPPPPPTPRILNLPRRNHRRRRTFRTVSSSYVERPMAMDKEEQEEEEKQREYREKLESLLDRERKFADNSVSVEEERDNGGGLTEEKWRFQAEILRAECNFLRMEREIALKKMERNKTQMEITLRSAIEGLVSGRKKIYEGKSVDSVLEEEIEYLEEMLGELQSGSYAAAAAAKDLKVKKCSNFDRKAVVLRRRLESLGGFLPDDQIQKRSGAAAIKEKESASSNENSIAVVPPPSLPNSITRENCSGKCKSIVRRIVEQVRAETDQWSQMQEMVGRVRDEMEELQLSREFWEDRALDSEFEIRSLRCLVEEWRENATIFEAKGKDLETEVSSLKEKLKKKKKEKNQRRDRDIAPPVAAAAATVAEEEELVLLSCGLKKEIPRRHRVSGNGSMGVPRLPFRNIGNSLSPLAKMSQSSSNKGRNTLLF